ncbi:MAG TPA: hypothetical protein VKV26_12855 [Dehalococcoidia bacterium]|nr:hypothetical protein [Dehalococcoidia bacterium]
MVKVFDGWPELRRRGVLASPLLWLFAVLAVVSLYDVYRYPARINAAATSPTYANTPLWVSLGKYAAILLLTGALAYTVRSQVRGRLLRCTEQRVWLALAVWCTLAGAGHALVAQSTEVLRPLGAILGVAPLLWLLPAAFAASHRLWADYKRAVVMLAFGLLLLHAVADVVEIALWFATGRLPALGYSGALVRFGGIWDDPNSAGAYAALCLIVLAGRERDLPRSYPLLLAGSGLFVLAVSWSFSGALMLVTGLFVLGLLQSTRRVRFLLISACVALSLIALAPFVARDYGRVPVIGNVLQQKVEGSVGSRQSALTHGVYLADLPRDPLSWLVGRAHPRQNEAAVVWWIDSVGLVGALLLAWWLYLMLRGAARTRQRDAALTLSAAIFVGSLFVPYLTTLPIGTYYVVGLGALVAMRVDTAAADRRHERSPAAAQSAESAGLAAGPT